MRRRIILFSAGFAIGGLMFIAGGLSWQPTPPKCSGCAVLSPTVHNPSCTEAVQGGWVCEGR